MAKSNKSIDAKNNDIIRRLNDGRNNMTEPTQRGDSSKVTKTPPKIYKVKGRTANQTMYGLAGNDSTRTNFQYTKEGKMIQVKKKRKGGTC